MPGDGPRESRLIVLRRALPIRQLTQHKTGMRLLSFADIHAPFLIRLTDDRPVVMDRLLQHRTYSGLLVGLPQECHVPMLIEGVVESARRSFGETPEPHVIQPRLIDYECQTRASRLDRNGTLTAVGEQAARVTGRRLPLVTCIASLMCPVTVHPPKGAGVFAKSVATVIWFQESFGPPLEEEEWQRLQSLDWNNIAIDVSD
jgi:hypothetical protein